MKMNSEGNKINSKMNCKNISQGQRCSIVSELDDMLIFFIIRVYLLFEYYTLIIVGFFKFINLQCT